MTLEKLLEEKERTSVLANERTYAAWTRTGITAMAAGLGIERFLGGVIPDYIVRAISMSLLLFSILAFILGIWRYIHVGSRLKSNRVSGAPSPILLLMSIMLCFVSLMALIGLWLV